VTKDTHLKSRLILVAIATTSAGAAFAADSGASTNASADIAGAIDSTGGSPETTLDSVIVTGTRDTDVKARDSAAPVVVLGADALESTGATNLRDALERTLPSLNRQSFGGDLGTLTDAIQLRGLSPDDVLVLVNGKRRHTTANIYLDSGPQQGSAPTDLDLIPVSAVDHIEVLEDGAAALYGSDAIAGVINIILKSEDRGGGAEGTVGQYYQGDGFSGAANADVATSLGEGGFAHFSADYRHQDHSVRSGPDSRTGNVDNLIFGDPESTRISLAYNADKSFADDAVELYSFGTYAHRHAESYENFRLPSILPAVYPAGFSPQEKIDEADFSDTLGVKGKDLLGWHWDLSTTYGLDDDNFGLIDSGNPGLFALTGGTPTRFHISTNKLTQWTNNLDLTHPFEIGLAAPLNVSLGAEYRRERYTIGSGDPESYLYGGSQSYVALEPVSAGKHQRSNVAGYLDFSVKPVAAWTVDLAGRYEHYTDFGNATSGKLTTRYDFTSQFALRATASNGFRAPSLAQEYFSNLNVSPTGASGQLAVNSPAALALGASPLRAEKSTNFSLGTVLEPLEGLHATLDGYYVKIKNRIIEGGTYQGPVAVSALESQGVTFPPGIDPADVSAFYFSNGADTKTYGVDFTADYRTSIGEAGHIDWDAEANWTHTQVTRIGLDENRNPLLNLQGVANLTTAQPESKVILGGVWSNHGYSATLHEIRYGTSIFQDTYYAGPNIFSNKVFYRSVDPARYVTNLEAAYKWTSGFQWIVGANNLFNAYPKALPAQNRYIGAARFDGNTGLGIDGGYYYTRLSFKF
jgi:iron complex outermembrane recepter protein